MKIPFLNPDPENPKFPKLSTCNEEGILAAGGCLNINWLLHAYRLGVFPWYSDYEPILWWFPNPRFVLFLEKFHFQKSLRPLLAKNHFRVTFDTAFEKVILHCKTTPRNGQEGTWITYDVAAAYIDLYRAGYAHSVEVWNQDKLVGGLYGVSLGRHFFGESMFALEPNASKVGFVILSQFLLKNNFLLIDCQQETDHLRTFGAELIPASQFEELQLLNNQFPTIRGQWINE